MRQLHVILPTSTYRPFTEYVEYEIYRAIGNKRHAPGACDVSNLATLYIDDILPFETTYYWLNSPRDVPRDQLGSEIAFTIYNRMLEVINSDILDLGEEDDIYSILVDVIGSAEAGEIMGGCIKQLTSYLEWLRASNKVNKFSPVGVENINDHRVMITFEED